MTQRFSYAKHLLALSVLLVLALALLPGTASAQLGGEELPEGVEGEDVYRVSSQMYCDVCAGVPISSCPSPTCAAWRQEIANLLGQGFDDTEVMGYFADRYGDEVTGVPLREEDRNFALGLPALLILIVGVLVVYQLWRLQSRGGGRAQVAANAAGVLPDHKRPVPDNVDPSYLHRFLSLLEER